MSIIHAELQKLAPSAVIELYQLQLFPSIHGVTVGVDDIYRFHAGTNELNSDIVWAGNTYTRYPVEATGFEYTGSGQLPRPTLTVANVTGLITALLLLVNDFNPGNDLIKSKFTRIRTQAKFLDAVNFSLGTNPNANPSAEWPQEIYFIEQKVLENRDIVQFEMVSSFDMVGVRCPGRQTIENTCQWIYRSAECSYTGTNYFDVNDVPVATLALDKCGLRLSSCRKRFGQNAQLPFGSFPGLGGFA